MKQKHSKTQKKGRAIRAAVKAALLSSQQYYFTSRIESMSCSLFGETFGKARFVLLSQSNDNFFLKLTIYLICSFQNIDHSDHSAERLHDACIKLCKRHNFTTLLTCHSGTHQHSS